MTLNSESVRFIRSLVRTQDLVHRTRIFSHALSATFEFLYMLLPSEIFAVCVPLDLLAALVLVVARRFQPLLSPSIPNFKMAELPEYVKQSLKHSSTSRCSGLISMHTCLVDWESINLKEEDKEAH